MFNDVSRYYLLLLGLTLAAYGFSLFHGYVGEEANYTMMSMEMWQRHVFRSVVALGGVGGRPPLYNWLMIPLARMLGWSHVLLAARAVTLLATLGTAGVLALWSRQLWQTPGSGRMAFLLYLTCADVLFYRGWLAYADPLFAFFMVLAAYSLWSATVRRHVGWLAFSLLAIFASYLTKVITAYVFYAGVLGVLLMHRPYRTFLLSRRALFVALLGFTPLVVWLGVVARQDTIQVHWQMTDIVSKLLTVDSLSSYLNKLWSFPVTMALGLLPVSLWAGAGMVWQKKQQGALSLPMRGLLAMALVNFFPYWIAPQSAQRYVLPEYGFVVLMAVGYGMMPNGLPPWRWLRPLPWLAGMTGLGLLLSALAFPYYQSRVRGDNYARMADQVETAAHGFPIYDVDYSSVGLSVVSELDSRYMDRPLIVTPPAQFTDGVVMAYTLHDIPSDRQVKVQGLDESFYLVCRGRACESPIFYGGTN